MGIAALRHQFGVLSIRFEENAAARMQRGLCQEYAAGSA
jgi:hypothetical protein